MSIYDVTTFGAVGDNVADDTSAVQAAINAAGAANGGTVYFPAGQYRVTATLAAIGLAGVKLQGDNWNASQIRIASSLTTLEIRNCEGIEVDRLGFHPNTSKTAGSEIFVENSLSVIVSKVNIFDADPGSQPYEGITLRRGGSSQFKYWIEDTEINGTRHDGLSVGQTGGQVQDIWLRNVIFARCAEAGLLLFDASGVNCNNIEILQCEKGMATFPGPGQVVKAVQITNGICDANNESGFKLLTNGGNVYDCVFDCCWFATNADHGVWIAGSGIDGVVFSSCQMLNNMKHGFLLQTGINVQLTSSQIGFNGMASPNTYSGVRVMNQVSQWIISSNMSGSLGQFGSINQQSYGFEIGSGCSFGLLANNLALGNSSGGFSIASTLSVNTGNIS